MKVGVDCVGVGIGALIINKERKIFLALRGQKAKNERGLWETPGGGAEFGETMEQTVVREMKEEYGFRIDPLEVFYVYDHILHEEGQHWVAITFLCKVKVGKPKILEVGKCDAIGWFSIAEAEKLPLAQTAQHDIEELKKRYPDGIPNLY